MTKIKVGGKLTGFKEDSKLEVISINAQENSRTADFWINGHSLSYVTLEELLDLKDEIQLAINRIVGAK